jgi:PhnB protein
MTTSSGENTTPRIRRGVPEGYYTVTPWIISRDTATLLDFMKQAFGAEELGRVYNEDGSIGHAEARIGDSIVMPFDARKEWPDTPAFLRLYVEDSDAVYQRALDAGATSVTEITNMAWGDRGGRVRDPLGNIWWITTRIEDLDPEEIARRMGEKEYIEAMRYAQSAEFFPSDKLKSED